MALAEKENGNCVNVPYQSLSIDIIFLYGGIGVDFGNGAIEPTN
jgi:hypothetical protein